MGILLSKSPGQMSIEMQWEEISGGYLTREASLGGLHWNSPLSYQW